MRRSSLFYLTLFCSFVCFLLGLWQWQRLGWKEDLLAQIDAKCRWGKAIALPPQKEWRNLDRDPLGWEPWGWQKVQFRASRTSKKVQLWYQGKFIRLSLARLDSGGQILLQEQGQNITTGATDTGVADIIQAVLYPSQKRRFFDVKDNVAKGNYYVRDIEKIAKGLGARAGGTLPFIADLSQTCPKVNNRHFGYMLTWFLLMLLLPIAAIFGKKEK